MDTVVSLEYLDDFHIETTSFLTALNYCAEWNSWFSVKKLLLPSNSKFPNITSFFNLMLQTFIISHYEFCKIKVWNIKGLFYQVAKIKD